MVKSPIKKKDLPCIKHDKFLAEQELLLQEGWELITDKLVDALLAQMKQEKLIKSERLAKTDPETLLKLVGTASERGFTGNIPRIELDLSFTSTLIDRYLAAIKWMIMGKAAGEDVEKIVDALKLKDRLPVGVVFGTMLNAIDVQRELYEVLKEKRAPKINNNSLKYALKFVNERSGKWCDHSMLSFRNRLLQEIQDKIEGFNNDNINQVHKDYHGLVRDRDLVASQIKTIEAKQALVAESVKNVLEKKMSLIQMKQSLKDTTKDYGKDWDRLVTTEVGMASGAGTHLAVQEIFSGDDEEVLVANVNLQDQRCCAECESWGRNIDGTLKLYRLKDIKPVGYNIQRKRRDWYLTAGTHHPRCRCVIVYVPPGFTVDDDGDLVPLKPGQKNKIERTAALP